MKKCTIACVLFYVAVTLSSMFMIGYATSTNTPDALSHHVCVLSDLSVFSELRQAVLEKDVDGIRDFSRYSGFEYIGSEYLPDSIESAQQLLSLFDEKCKPILGLSGISNDVDPEYKINFYAGSVRGSYHLCGWKAEGWYSEKSAPILEGRTDVVFTWETVDGEKVSFFPASGDSYLGQFSIPQGFITVYFHKETESADDIPPIKQFGNLYAESFTAWTSKKDVNSLVWLALPVGVAVVGGVAVILFRRKKKPAPAAAEE